MHNLFVLLNSKGDLKFKYLLYHLILLFIDSRNLLISYLCHKAKVSGMGFLCCCKMSLTVYVTFEQPTCYNSWSHKFQIYSAATNDKHM